MAQKNATPTKEQKAALKKNGLPEYLWTVMKEYGHALLVRHRITGEVKLLEK